MSTGSGAVAFFPLSVGNKWVYVDKLSGEQGTVTNQVVSVTPVASGSKVVMKDSDDLGGGAPDTTTSALIVHPDGSITVPMTTMGNSFKIKSGGVLWPSAAQLASGQPHHDTLVMTMSMAGQTTTMRTHITVKGDGIQTVHVPGRYLPGHRDRRGDDREVLRGRDQDGHPDLGGEWGRPGEKRDDQQRGRQGGDHERRGAEVLHQGLNPRRGAAAELSPPRSRR